MKEHSQNSEPQIFVAPVDWSAEDIALIDPVTRKTILPAEWDDPADDGLYDDLV